MRGPYLLRPLQVDISVPVRVGGAYCLAKNGREVCYVGRAEHDLREKLKTHWPEYQHFWYETALSPREAYLGHCRAFHKHMCNGHPENGEHPTPPDKLDIKCPVCGK